MSRLCRYNVFTYRRANRYYESRFADEIRTLTGKGMLNRNFSPFEEQITVSSCVNEDKTVFVWWLGMTAFGISWNIQMFIQAEWHDWDDGTNNPFLFSRICTITAQMILEGETFSSVTEKAIAEMEEIVAESNRTGFLPLLDKDTDYRGPRLVKSVKIVPNPGYVEKLSKALAIKV